MPTFEDLIETLTDENILPFSKLSVISALGRLNDKSAVPYLIETLQSENHYVRRESARALGLLDSPEAVEPLIEAIELDKDNEVRRNAITALGQLSDERAVDILTQALQESSFLIKRAAEGALKQIGGENWGSESGYSAPATQKVGMEMPAGRHATESQSGVGQTVSYRGTPVEQPQLDTDTSTGRDVYSEDTEINAENIAQHQRRIRRTEGTRSLDAMATQDAQIEQDSATDEQWEDEEMEISAEDIAQHQQRARETESVRSPEVEETQDVRLEPDSVANEQWETDEMEISDEDIAQHQQKVRRTESVRSPEVEETQDVQLEPDSVADEQWGVDEDDSTEPDAEILIRDSAAKQAENYETQPSYLDSTTQTQRATVSEPTTQTRAYDDNTYVQVQTRTPPEESPPQTTRKRAWRCKSCGEVISCDFRDCWNCGTSGSGGKPVDYEATDNAPVESDINIISCPQCGAEMREGVLFTGDNELIFNYQRNKQTNDVVIDTDALGRVCLRCRLIFLKF